MTRRLEHAPHERHGRIEVVGRGIGEPHGDHHVGVVGAIDALRPSWRTTTRYCTLTAPPAHATAREQVVLAIAGAGSTPRASGRGSSPPTGTPRSAGRRRGRTTTARSGRPGWHAPAAHRCGPTGTRRCRSGGDAVVLSGPVEPLLLERRLALDAQDHALVDGHQPGLRPDRVVQLRRLPGLAQASGYQAGSPARSNAGTEMSCTFR